MKLLLSATAILEGITGLGLVIAPSILVSILLGPPLGEPGAIIVARIAGVALLTVAIACWLSRNHGQQATGIVQAMFFYNTAAAFVFIYAGLGAHFTGIGIWPAVIIHACLAGWCINAIKKQTQYSAG